MRISAAPPLALLVLAAGCASQLTPEEAAVTVTASPAVVAGCTPTGPISIARDREAEAQAFVVFPEGQSAGYNAESVSIEEIQRRAGQKKANAVLLKPDSTTAETFLCPAAPANPPAP